MVKQVVAFKKLFQIPPDEIKNVGDLFNEAKQVKVNHSHSFEQLLSMKDITPEKPAITVN